MEQERLPQRTNKQERLQKQFWKETLEHVPGPPRLPLRDGVSREAGSWGTGDRDRDH